VGAGRVGEVEIEVEGTAVNTTLLILDQRSVNEFLKRKKEMEILRTSQQENETGFRGIQGQKMFR
jgi:hypothetical protein